MLFPDIKLKKNNSFWHEKVKTYFFTLLLYVKSQTKWLTAIQKKDMFGECENAKNNIGVDNCRTMTCTYLIVLCTFVAFLREKGRREVSGEERIPGTHGSGSATLKNRYIIIIVHDAYLTHVTVTYVHRYFTRDSRDNFSRENPRNRRSDSDAILPQDAINRHLKLSAISILRFSISRNIEVAEATYLSLKSFFFHAQVISLFLLSFV